MQTQIRNYSWPQQAMGCPCLTHLASCIQPLAKFLRERKHYDGSENQSKSFVSSSRDILHGETTYLNEMSGYSSLTKPVL